MYVDIIQFVCSGAGLVCDTGGLRFIRFYSGSIRGCQVYILVANTVHFKLAHPVRFSTVLATKT